MQLLLSLLLLFIISTSVNADIAIYTTQEPPLNFTSKTFSSYDDGRYITGFSTDIVREIMRRTKTPATIRLLPWVRSYNYALTEKNTLIYSIARSPLRENLFKWIGPLAIKKAIIMGKKSNEQSYDTLDKLKNSSRIVAMKDDSKYQYLMQRGFNNVYDAVNWDAAVKMLFRDQAEVWTTTNLDAPVIMKHAGLNINELKTEFVMFESVLYIGASKETPDKLVEQWQKSLNQIKQDGTFKRLVEKWADYYQVSNWIYKDGVLQTLNTPR